MHSKKGLRVVYDAISDFVSLTDFQLAMQYIRHNMGWENESHVESLYLLRAGTLSHKETEQYLFSFANGLLKLERTFSDKNDKRGYLQADFRGPFRIGPRKFKLNYQFKLLDEYKMNS